MCALISWIDPTERELGDVIENGQNDLPHDQSSIREADAAKMENWLKTEFPRMYYCIITEAKRLPHYCHSKK